MMCLGSLVFAIVVGCWYASGWPSTKGPSTASFYGYTKRGHKVVCGSTDVDAFIDAFSRTPDKVHFRFVGRQPEAGGIRRYFAQHSANAFDVKLDLTHFLSDKAFLTHEERDTIRHFLTTGNALEALRIRKSVVWDCWDDLATLVRQRLEELGFTGKVDAWLECDEQIVVFQNHYWSNVLRSWIVQLVLMLSVFGGIVFFPYMWVRAKHSAVDFRFHVRIEPVHYWDLIKVGIRADHGFHVK